MTGLKMFRTGVFPVTVTGEHHLNVWQCEGCGKMECIGSRQELEEKSGNPEAQTVELHRPYIDAITSDMSRLWKDNEESARSYRLLV